MCRGVVVVRVGSRIIIRGPIERCWNERLKCVTSLVAPAIGVYSPADSDVGIQIMGIVAGRRRRGVGLSKYRVSRSSTVVALLAMAWNC